MHIVQHRPAHESVRGLQGYGVRLRTTMCEELCHTRAACSYSYTPTNPFSWSPGNIVLLLATYGRSSTTIKFTRGLKARSLKHIASLASALRPQQRSHVDDREASPRRARRHPLKPFCVDNFHLFLTHHDMTIEAVLASPKSPAIISGWALIEVL